MHSWARHPQACQLSSALLESSLCHLCPSNLLELVIADRMKVARALRKVVVALAVHCHGWMTASETLNPIVLTGNSFVLTWQGDVSQSASSVVWSQRLSIFKKFLIPSEHGRHYTFASIQSYSARGHQPLGLAAVVEKHFSKAVADSCEAFLGSGNLHGASSVSEHLERVFSVSKDSNRTSWRQHYI